MSLRHWKGHHHIAQGSVIPRALLVSYIRGYTLEQDRVKKAFHREGARFLRDVAARLGLKPGTYDVRSNKAGPAVSGEVTLHGERIYVQLYESCVGLPGVSILYRRCQGQRDYTGERNNDVRVDRLNDPEVFRAWLARLEAMIRQ